MCLSKHNMVDNPLANFKRFFILLSTPTVIVDKNYNAFVNKIRQKCGNVAAFNLS